MYPLAARAPVGLPAPDFAAQAYFPETDSTGTVRLRDYHGDWLLINFYSGDFTFV